MPGLEEIPSYAEQVLDLPMDCQQPLSLDNGFEPTNLALFLTGMLVRNFSSVVFVLAGPMFNRWEDLSVSGRVALEFVCDELPWRPALSFQHFTKESLSGFLVSSPCDEDVENIAILIDFFQKVVLLDSDLHEDLIDVPDVAQAALFPPNFPSVFGSKLGTPEPDGLVGHHDSALSQQILDVAKAQSETVIEPHCATNDFCWEAMAVVEGIHPVIFSRAHQLDNAARTGRNREREVLKEPDLPLQGLSVSPTRRWRRSIPSGDE